MLVAAAIAFWKGWQIHHGETAVLAYGLGAVALALGVWHLTRKAPRPTALIRVWDDWFGRSVWGAWFGAFDRQFCLQTGGQANRDIIPPT